MSSQLSIENYHRIRRILESSGLNRRGAIGILKNCREEELATALRKIPEIGDINESFSPRFLRGIRQAHGPDMILSLILTYDPDIKSESGRLRIAKDYLYHEQYEAGDALWYGRLDGDGDL